MSRLLIASAVLSALLGVAIAIVRRFRFTWLP